MFNLRKKPAESVAAVVPEASTFHIDNPFMQFGYHRDDFITWRELFEGVIVYGSAGSGKSWIVIQAFARTIIRPVARGGMGGGAFFTTTRPNEAAAIKAWAELEGRGGDVVIVRPHGEWTMDIIRHEASLADTLMKPRRVLDAFAQVAQLLGNKSGNSNDFFMTSALSFLEQCVALLNLVEFDITLDSIHAISQTSTTALEDYDESIRPLEEGEEKSLELLDTCGFALATAWDRLRDGELNAYQEREYKRLSRFFFERWHNMAEETRSGILATYATLTDALLSGLTNQLFFSDTPNLTPEWAIENDKIVILDLPTKEHGEGARLAQMLTLWQFGRAIERRKIAGDDTSTTGFLLVLDEFHQFVAPDFFLDVTATLRGSRGIFLCATQSHSAFLTQLNSSRKTEQANAILGNLQLKIALSTADAATALWLADAVGKDDISRASISTQNGEHGMTSGASVSVQMNHVVKPVEFQTLAKADENAVAEAIIWRTGRQWGNPDKPEPALQCDLSLATLLKGYDYD